MGISHNKVCLWLALVVSWCSISLGQPYLIWQLGWVASAIGYALFWWAIRNLVVNKQRFWIGFAFFFTVQLLQLSWLISHPYGYIWVVYFLLCGWLAIEFGILTIVIHSWSKHRMWSLSCAALWTLMEWTRLLPLCGLSFGTIGLSLACTLSSLQLASLQGIFGLSFWVVLTNCLGLRLLCKERNFSCLSVFLITASLPYIFGCAYLNYLDPKDRPTQQNQEQLNVLLLETSFHPEESDLSLKTFDDYVLQALLQWKVSLQLIEPFKKEPIDLVVIPELIVPFPYDIPLFSLREMNMLNSALVPWEKLAGHLDNTQKLQARAVWHGLIADCLAKQLNTSVLIGLESYRINQHSNSITNSALLFSPTTPTPLSYTINRWPYQYDKSILLPMAESIPFEWVKPLAKEYGITDSFMPGSEAVSFPLNKGAKMGISICYEEMFSNFMRQNALIGNNLLANLTNDAWYPHSILGKSHLEHARPRSVELGMSMIRSCNFGPSIAIDEFGQTIKPTKSVKLEDGFQSHFIKVPLNTHKTLFTLYGETPLIILCMILLSYSLLSSTRKRFFY